MKGAVESMIQNAQGVKEVLKGRNGKQKKQDLLWRYVHLRPTASGVTIVSQHLAVFMRGMICSTNQLVEMLWNLYEQTEAFAADVDTWFFRSVYAF